MRESIFETLIGAAVVVVAGVFLWFALARGGEAASAPSGSVEIGARFSSVSGVDRGTDVRMAGVKVGTVRAIKLDVDRAEALVTMALSKDLFPLEDGASARIQAEGLLGGNYISLEPGPGFGEIEPCVLLLDGDHNRKSRQLNRHNEQHQSNVPPYLFYHYLRLVSQHA